MLVGGQQLAGVVQPAFLSCSTVPLGSLRPFRPKASPVAKLITFPAAEVTSCKALPLVLLNMMRSPGASCAPDCTKFAKLIHVGSTVRDWPFTAIDALGHPGSGARGGLLTVTPSSP